MALLRRSADPLTSISTVFSFACLFIVSFLSVFFSLSLGSLEIGWQEIVVAVFNAEEDIQGRVIRELRLPRVVTGFLVGGMLAMAGALMQVLLKNPLAEPYVLGVSGGASVFALTAMMVGLSGFWINGGALAGALFTILLVFGLSQRGSGWNPMRMLLTGVVVAAGWGAMISFLLAISPAGRVQGMLFWLMGDLGHAYYSHYIPWVLIISLLLGLSMARNLNLLSFGDQQALSLGVAVGPLRYGIYFIASLLTATAVMLAGGIGFVGLIVPHAVRILFGSDHRIVLPACVLLGGCLLVIADSLARTLIAPQQMPVGVLTAIVGVPIFLVLLQTTGMRQKP